mgnify:CR=1 FL=1
MECPKVEIVPDQVYGFEINERVYLVSPASDCIVRFVEPQYASPPFLDLEAHAI